MSDECLLAFKNYVQDINLEVCITRCVYLIFLIRMRVLSLVPYSDGFLGHRVQVWRTSLSLL
jgi:hypothetical protein